MLVSIPLSVFHGYATVFHGYAIVFRGEGTIHILRKHIFRIFGPPPPLRKHVFSTENKQKLAFSDHTPLPPTSAYIIQGDPSIGTHF